MKFWLGKADLPRELAAHAVSGSGRGLFQHHGEGRRGCAPPPPGDALSGTYSPLRLLAFWSCFFCFGLVFFCLFVCLFFSNSDACKWKWSIWWNPESRNAVTLCMRNFLVRCSSRDHCVLKLSQQQRWGFATAKLVSVHGRARPTGILDLILRSMQSAGNCDL